MAAYEVADLIGDGIESLLAQTHPAHEIVVIDDGSSDDLPAALRRFGDRITYMRQTNRGAAAAMNAGIRASSGEFVVLIGADDLFAPQRLEALAELAMQRPDLDILSTDAYIAIGSEVFRPYYDETNPFEVANQRAEILRRNFIFGHTASRRSRVLEIGGLDETIRWTSDWELWIRMILGGSRVGIVAEPLATYRLWERSLSSQRLSQSRGKVMTLERTLGHPGLTSAERAIVLNGLEVCRREIAIGEAYQALLARTDARRRWWEVARTPSYKPLTRLKALGAIAAPPVARAIVLREQQSCWIGAGGVVVRREKRPQPMGAHSGE